MNPEQFLTKVEKLVTPTRPVTSGLYTLWLQGGQPKIERQRSCIDKRYILAVLTSTDINVGLTPARWDRIKDRFAILQKEGLK